MCFRGFSATRRFNGKWSKFCRVILVLFLVYSGLCSAQTQPTRTREAGTGIEGVITVGPTQGGPSRIGVPDSNPLANAAFVVENEKGAVASFVTDYQGRFQISLTPGHYTVSAKDRKPKVGRYGPFEVDVLASEMTKVAWYCDSGRR